MKKFSLLGICLLGAFAISAQTNVVKEVEQALKASKPDYSAAINKIKPALTDEATKNDPLAWKLAGQAGVGLYDELFLKEQLDTAELKKDEKLAAGHGLLDCYNYYLTAIPLDRHPDKKGVMKPGKLTKGMIKTMNENYSQLQTAAIFLFQASDNQGAYDTWEMFLTLPTNPLLGKDAPKAYPDTVVGQIMYYQMLASLIENNQESNERALAKFKPTLTTGYENPEVYIYGLEAARRLNDSISMVEIAQLGYDKYGTSNITFIGELINDGLNRNDYVSSEKLVREAIAATPDTNVVIKGQLYDILGVVYERQNNDEGAIENFKKAIEINPENGKGYYDVARIIYNQAVRLDDTAKDEAESNKLVTPKLLEAADYFVKAYELDKDNLTDIPNILYRLYYRLGDGYQDKAEEWQDK
ncbi:MAG: tetratricopeptide repeat protein [Bacteroidales bacterium]|nr:tetratricopeptide repeat protein [Bacteroidales bacterium]MBD5241780.1 tetratricopeptide repeat protein [Barnesiella sp.]